eukprot:1644341-Pyramimonas_sp.AAC.1
MYRSAYTSQDVPAACPLGHRRLRELDDSHKCRGGKTTSDAVAIHGQGSGSGGSMEHAMMRQMQQQMTVLTQLAATAL